MDEVNVLIGSGGRRNYLVNWFRDAIKDLGLTGSVCVVDASPAAPALADADRSAVLPPFTSDEYFPALASLCGEWNVGLAFSLNDFEATRWAAERPSPFDALGVNVIAASPRCQALVEDKLAYGKAFSGREISTPETLSGAAALAAESLPWDGDVIIKHRFGSGSVGLARVSQVAWRDQAVRTAESAKDKSGLPVTSLNSGLENVVVQQAVDGTEYGVDVVHDFDGRYAGSLVRCKLRSRSGETDQALTVDNGPFDAAAQSVGRVTQHRGLIDTDFIVDQSGTAYVIDVNPRFGGGYPFSHVAGARIPRAYLSWHVGREAQAEWLTYDAGITASKTEDIRVARGVTGSAGHLPS